MGCGAGHNVPPICASFSALKRQSCYSQTRFAHTNTHTSRGVWSPHKIHHQFVHLLVCAKRQSCYNHIFANTNTHAWWSPHTLVRNGANDELDSDITDAQKEQVYWAWSKWNTINQLYLMKNINARVCTMKWKLTSSAKQQRLFNGKMTLPCPRLDLESGYHIKIRQWGEWLYEVSTSHINRQKLFYERKPTITRCYAAFTIY